MFANSEFTSSVTCIEPCSLESPTIGLPPGEIHIQSQHGAHTAHSTATTILEPVRTKGHLLRIVGVGFGIAVGIGGTIGSGILRTPGEVAAQLRTPWLVIAVWVLVGFTRCFSKVDLLIHCDCTLERVDHR